MCIFFRNLKFEHSGWFSNEQIAFVQVVGILGKKMSLSYVRKIKSINAPKNNQQRDKDYVQVQADSQSISIP